MTPRILTVYFLWAACSYAGNMDVLNTSGKQAWQAGKGAPKAEYRQNNGHIIHFKCPFKSSNQSRFYWDKKVDIDLTGYSELRFTFSCSRAEAIRKAGVYLKSGKGWYVWLESVNKPGTQTITLPLNNISTEGEVSGPDKISRIRLSFTMDANTDTEVEVQALNAFKAYVAIIQGTASIKDADERAVAAKAAKNIGKWISEAGILYDLYNDEDVKRGKLAGKRIGILSYNAFPDREEVRQLNIFLKNGGKLIVFYCSEPEVAEIMDMKLGSYKSSDIPGHWDSFIFNKKAPENVPLKVFQDSHNTRAAYPRFGKSKVIAYWHNSEGKKLSDPAWTESEKGFWMSHILNKQNSKIKKRLLVALMGHLCPQVWERAAEQVIKNSVQSEFRERLKRIRRQAEGSSQAPAADNLLKEAQRRIRQMRDLFKQGRYTQVVESSYATEAVLDSAYSITQEPQDDELRGIWDHSGTGLYLGNWERTCEVLKQAGVTDIFVNMVWPNMVHYSSEAVEESVISRKYGDQIQACVTAAHKHNLRVHIWVVCLKLHWNADADKIKQLKEENLLQEDINGKTLKWLCPSNPGNVKILESVIREIVKKYAIDGIHLDYIRYPDSESCYCSGCRKRFENWLGRPVENWPSSVNKGKLHKIYFHWRRRQINNLIDKISRVIEETGSTTKLSAAVYPNYPSCRESIGQDWVYWIKRGKIDFVCPMDYVSDTNTFKELINKQFELVNNKNRIFPGLGVTTSNSELSTEELFSQIKYIRQKGGKGFILFDLDKTLEQDVLPLLSAGITGTK
jgi:uncharacterized lipoprotein YddW (UPF0748 family)